MDEWMKGRMNGWMDEWMEEWMNPFMHGLVKFDICYLMENKPKQIKEETRTRHIYLYQCSDAKLGPWSLAVLRNSSQNRANLYKIVQNCSTSCKVVQTCANRANLVNCTYISTHLFTCVLTCANWCTARRATRGAWQI